MPTVAVAVTCKTPLYGLTKTRLSPPLTPQECAALSACFIRDIAATVARLAAGGDVAAVAAYTPRGSEAVLRPLLPEGFALLPQGEGDLGARMLGCVSELLDRGHAGVVLLGADAPTLPASILRAAIDVVRGGEDVALCPTLDGGYLVIGLARPHARLFADIPWSTDAVYRLTRERAREIGVGVAELPGWYDVDDAASLAMLEAELAGKRPNFAAADLVGASAPATRQFMQARRSRRP